MKVMITLDSVCCTKVAQFIVGVLFLYWGAKFLKRRNDKKKWEQWNVKSKDKVIIHGLYGNSKTLPSVSPFVLKLDTYCRIAKIPFEIDKTSPWGPIGGKTPWISAFGENVGDSQLCIEFLKKKFEVDLNTNYSEEKKAIATTVRIMLEEHLYWGGVLWRFQYGGRETFQKVVNGESSFMNWFIFKMIASQLQDAAWKQGLGRHSEEKVHELMMKDLQAISKILGNNCYLLGRDVCEEDAALFAFLSSGILDTNGPFQKYLNDELKNLKDYFYRMKQEFWPDWDKYLNP